MEDEKDSQMGESNIDEKAEIQIGEEKKLSNRKFSWAKLRRVDSLNLEAGRLSSIAGHASSKVNWATTLSLAYQSVGIVYGDIGTSPLYVYSSTFTDGIKHNDDVIGVLSLIIYTIALIPMLKYVFIVLWANDNGDGGTFALYSLICRYTKVSLIPNQQPEDRELSNYQLEIPSHQLKRSQRVKEVMEKSKFVKLLLLLVTIMATSMVIGDGVLTPSISVLSAVGGIDSLSTNAIVAISVAILIILFSAQRFGTDKVGFTFAPIIFIWFFFIGGIGLYNLFKYEVGVLRAFNPKYIVDYFKRNGTRGWISLGGVFLCITGTEAMFADLGHFNVRAIQLSFSCFTFPALVAAYSGQAAYLRKFPDHVEKTFYDSIPDPIYWPTFVAAVGASIIASQAMISGAFSIISQSLSLGCFPRVKVVHTSAKYEGQVYIPEINYILMILCVIVTASFKTTTQIGNAYGIAVVTVMFITTCMLTLIMVVIWKTNIWLIALFFIVFGTIEAVYVSAVFYKFVDGGYLPLAFAAFLMAIMLTWHYVYQKRYTFEMKNKVSTDFIRDIVKNRKVNRIPGIGLLYSELVQGIPPIFPHFIANIPSIHSVLVLISIKSLPIPKVELEERFLFRQVESREYRMFRCVVRYGYNEVIEETTVFEQQLVENLKEFIRQEHITLEGLVEDPPLEQARLSLTGLSQDQSMEVDSNNSSNRIVPTTTQVPLQGSEEEIQIVEKAMKNGVVYLLGETEVRAEPKSSFFKMIIVDYLYDFLRKNFRQGETVLAIPRSRLLRVGMTYDI